MRRFVLVSLLTLGSLAAQVMPMPTRLPAGIVGYLELTEAQQLQIAQANTALQNFMLQKARRTAQVQLEISTETAKPDLDAMALGMRYRELEAIRRETTAEQRRTVETVQAILTTAQKQKLGELQEALRVQSTACEAVNVNIMLPPPQFAPSPWIATGSFASFLLVPNGIPSLNMCGVTGGIRTGDFTLNPTLP